jgi:uncharacterized protein (UPF0332 family)
MRSARHVDQYSFSAAPSCEEVESAIQGAQAFITRMERLLDETGPGK